MSVISKLQQSDDHRPAERALTLSGELCDVAEGAGLAGVLVVELSAGGTVEAGGAVDGRDDTSAVEELVGVAVAARRTNLTVSLVQLVLVVACVMTSRRKSVKIMYMYV